MRLLIADDHSLFREAMALYVERTSPEAEVILAKDLGEAIECVERGNKAPDLVLLDLNMPGMNGLKGFAEFRKKFPDLPAALLSGVAEPEDVQEAMDLGAVGFFPKHCPVGRCSRLSNWSCWVRNTYPLILLQAV
jgi:two-component system nitrate/nitrite response regulator NarL